MMSRLMSPMLKELLRKDLRLCRLPLVAGLLLLLGPFVFAASIVVYMPLWTESTRPSAWAVLLGTGCYFSLMCSQPTLAMLSGNLIAAERADRSAQFLAYLPPSRGTILLSKLMVLALAAAIIWGLYFAVSTVAHLLAGETDAANMLTSELASAGRLSAIGVAAMGGGWVASSVSENTGPAVSLAFLSPIAILGAMALLRYLLGWPDELAFARVYFSNCSVFGLTTMILGCLLYLRRTEP